MHTVAHARGGGGDRARDTEGGLAADGKRDIKC
jgi:hypothetical protein